MLVAQDSVVGVANFTFGPGVGSQNEPGCFCTTAFEGPCQVIACSSTNFRNTGVFPGILDQESISAIVISTPFQGNDDLASTDIDVVALVFPTIIATVVASVVPEIQEVGIDAERNGQVSARGDFRAEALRWYG